MELNAMPPLSPLTCAFYPGLSCQLPEVLSFKGSFIKGGVELRLGINATERRLMAVIRENCRHWASGLEAVSHGEVALGLCTVG